MPLGLKTSGIVTCEKVPYPAPARARRWPAPALCASAGKGGHISKRDTHSSIRPQDPAETWELACSESEGHAYFRGAYDVFPRRPHRAEEVPRGALESLSELCGLEGLHQVFIIPWAVRSTGWGDQKVMTPNSVLAVGGRAVGLWTDKPEPGVKVMIPAENLAAIEDITILLYGRLSFLPAGDRLTIRYNTLARPGLEPALMGLRRNLAGPPLSVPREDARAEELPFKWKHLLSSELVRLSNDASVAFRFATAPRRSWVDIERGQLLVLNAHELVYMCDPIESSHKYGADSFILPRSTLTGVRAHRDTLDVTANGARFSLSMVTELGEAAARWFA